MLKAFTIFLLLVSFQACRKAQPGVYDPNVAVGGVGVNQNPTTADEMLRMQEKEAERQQKELEDIKRQEYYDNKYRQHLRGY